ncbi:MAG: tetratricopeptide repeat protein, partial [Bacteroidaceae bacterium]|nr:tetratricopeptide repeat protein [Bacteroidaceae bacterium]
MKGKNRFALFIAILLCLALPASASKKKKRPANQHDTTAVAKISDEEQRRFDYFFLEGVRKRNMGDYAQAYELFQHASDIQPQAPEVLFEMANFMGYLANDSVAQSCYEQASLLSPNNKWYQEVLSNYYQTHNQLDKAVDILEQMSDAEPENADYLYGLLQMYTRKQDFEKSILTLDRLESLEGKSEQLTMNKFQMFLQLGQKEQAFEEMEALTKEYPNDLRYRVILGDLYLNNDDAEKAREIYEQVLNEEPQNVNAQVSMSSYYEQIGDSVKAKSMMETLVLNPTTDSQTRVQVMRKIIHDAEAQRRDSTYVLDLFNQLLDKQQEDAGMALLCTQYKLQKQMPETEIT